MTSNNENLVIDLLPVFLKFNNFSVVPNLTHCLNRESINISDVFSVHDFIEEYREDNGTGLWIKCLQQVLGSNRYSSPYTMCWKYQLFWGILFAILTVVAASGNAIVMWIILAHRRMRTVTNFFLLNLAVADFMMATLNVVFNFVFMLESHWPFHTLYCNLNNFVSNLTVATSVFTLTAMSLDRYIAIVRPLKPRMSKKLARIVIVCIWIGGALLSLPPLLYSTTTSYRYPDGKIRTVCYTQWPDRKHSGLSRLEHFYNIAFLVLTYIVPMGFMLITYPWMGCVLWGSTGIGEVTERQRNAVKAKKKVVLMFIAIVLIFAICWLPYHAYFLYTYHYKEVVHHKYIQHVYLGLYWLAMSNSMYSPLIYYKMNGRFRRYFLKVFCCSCRRRQATQESSPRRTAQEIRMEQTSNWSIRRKSFRMTFSTTANGTKGSPV